MVRQQSLPNYFPSKTQKISAGKCAAILMLQMQIRWDEHGTHKHAQHRTCTRIVEETKNNKSF